MQRMMAHAWLDYDGYRKACIGVGIEPMSKKPFKAARRELLEDVSISTSFFFTSLVNLPTQVIAFITFLSTLIHK